MAEQIVKEYPHVQSATYTLPNKHYIPVDMRYAGIDNLTPYVSFPLCPVFLFGFACYGLVSTFMPALAAPAPHSSAQLAPPRTCTTARRYLARILVFSHGICPLDLVALADWPHTPLPKP